MREETTPGVYQTAYSLREAIFNVCLSSRLNITCLLSQLLWWLFCRWITRGGSKARRDIVPSVRYPLILLLLHEWCCLDYYPGYFLCDDDVVDFSPCFVSFSLSFSLSLTLIQRREQEDSVSLRQQLQSQTKFFLELCVRESRSTDAFLWCNFRV